MRVIPVVELQFAFSEMIDAIIPAVRDLADLTAGCQKQQGPDPAATENSVHEEVRWQPDGGGRDPIQGVDRAGHTSWWHRPTARLSLPIISKMTYVSMKTTRHVVKVNAASRTRLPPSGQVIRSGRQDEQEKNRMKPQHPVQFLSLTLSVPPRLRGVPLYESPMLAMHTGCGLGSERPDECWGSDPAMVAGTGLLGSWPLSGVPAVLEFPVPTCGIL